MATTELMLQRVEDESQLEFYKRMVTTFKPRYFAALPRDVNPQRFLDFAVTAIQRKPELLECTWQSLCQSIYVCAATGLLPESPLGHAFLVPMWSGKRQRKEVTMIPGYKGYTFLAYRSNMIASIEAHVVCEKDEFEHVYGTEGYLRHKESLEDDRGKMIAAWAKVHYNKPGVPPRFEVMRAYEILKIKSESPGAKYEVGPWWNPDTEPEMWKKTVVRRMAKLMPQSDGDALTMAVAYENQVDDQVEPDESFIGFPSDMMEQSEPVKKAPATSRVMSGFKSKAEETEAVEVPPEPEAEVKEGPSADDILLFMDEHKDDLPSEMITQFTRERLEAWDAKGRAEVFAEIQAATSPEDKGLEGGESAIGDTEAGSGEKEETAEQG